MQLQPPNPNMNQSPFMFAPQEPEEAGFDFWGILRRRKWLIFLGMLAGLAVGGIYNSQAQKIYESVATVTIQPKEKQIFTPNGSGDPYGQSRSFNIRHDQLIGEHNIIYKCLTDFGLNKLETLRDLPEEEQITEIQSNLKIAQNREEPIKYELEYQSIDASDAQTVLATIISTYEKRLDEQYRDNSRDLTELLSRMQDSFSEQLDKVNAKLEAARAEAQPFKVAGTLKLNQSMVADSLSLIEKEKQKYSELTSYVARAEKALEDGTEACMEYVWQLEQAGQLKSGQIQLEDNSEQIARLQQTIEDMELGVAQLIMTEKLGPGHSRVKAMALAIDEWKTKLKELETEESRVVGFAPEDVVRMFLVNTKQQIGDLRSAMDMHLAEFRDQSMKASMVQMAEQRISEMEGERAIFLERAQIAKDQLVSQQSSEQQARLHKGFIFDTTKPATYGKDVWPILLVILPVAGLLGSMVGFGLGCLVELADKTFHNPDQITKHLQVPLIGHIPVIGQGKRYLVENSLIEPMVCTYHRPKSQVSEAFRAVRTALYFNTQGKQNSVIQVTSPTPGDGKSTLASNLAVSIAQSGKRVLLVDADMRRPRQHSTFGISSRVGFATVLSGQSEWRDCMFECEEIDGLTVMPCGAKPQNPAELSSSPQVKILIEEMREEFDFVIIDTPPMLAVTDPSPIAARVDGVVVCIRIKKNVRVSAERATQMLQNLGANCIGLVVNGVGAQSGYGSQYTYGAYRAGYSYNGYGYGYGYGYGNTGKYYDEDQKGRQARRQESAAGAPVLIESDE
jgi:capsular exopolysaccharide synthesis family protein